MSELIKTMLVRGEEEDEDKVQEHIPLPNVDSATLCKVIEFCKYYLANSDKICIHLYQV